MPDTHWMFSLSPWLSVCKIDCTQMFCSVCGMAIEAIFNLGHKSSRPFWFQFFHHVMLLDIFRLHNAFGMIQCDSSENKKGIRLDRFLRWRRLWRVQHEFKTEEALKKPSRYHLQFTVVLGNWGNKAESTTNRRAWHHLSILILEKMAFFMSAGSF